MEHCEAADLAKRIEDLIVVMMCRTGGSILQDCRESLVWALSRIELKDSQ